MCGNFVIGEVIAVSETRLSIRAGGIALGEDSVWINPTQNGQLCAGDRVVLLTEDRQTYYLVCKAVAYG